MKAVKDAKTYYFQCDCSSQEHTVGVTFDIENKEMTLDVQLHQWQPFYKRLWNAIKYIFGYQCKYGHWDTTVMNEEKFLALYNTMTRFMYTAGIKDKSKQKITQALQKHNKGEKNTMINSTHNEEKRDVLSKYSKVK